MATFTELKNLKNNCEDLASAPNWREVFELACDDTDDFEVDGVRFIKATQIDYILADELKSDLYMLGCFNAWFIAENGNTGLDADDIESLQENEAFEAIGRIIVKHGDMVQFAVAYASTDGYGHHFNHYDGGEEEWTINGVDYYVFDNRS